MDDKFFGFCVSVRIGRWEGWKPFWCVQFTDPSRYPIYGLLWLWFGVMIAPRFDIKVIRPEVGASDSCDSVGRGALEVSRPSDR